MATNDKLDRFRMRLMAQLVMAEALHEADKKANKALIMKLHKWNREKLKKAEEN